MTERPLPTGATSWVEIATSALRENFAAVAGFAGAPVCAVVKANAYGHGLIESARSFAEAGARMLAVTRWEEAREIRSSGISAPLLVLTPLPHDVIRDAIALDLALCVASVSDLEPIVVAAHDAGRSARVHLKVDTGMGRLGVKASEATAVAQRIADEQSLSLEGIWTHFASAGTPRGREQLARFESVRSALGKHAARAIVHAANSAATIAMPAARYDMVRVGTLLYGMNPPNARAPFPLRDAFTWYARILSIRTVAAGESVGYGSEWRAKRATRVATIAVGYADGFGLEPAARTESWQEAAKAGARLAIVAAGVKKSVRAVRLKGVRAPVVGRISMQQSTVSIGHIPDVRVGDVVEVPARRLLVGTHIQRIYL
ncbi:MAG: alanine racemase [Actinomycetota bacterium]|nr:alanine racemase [Actinomycetota bacterium]